jgi:hypothetical protein
MLHAISKICFGAARETLADATDRGAQMQAAERHHIAHSRTAQAARAENAMRLPL